MLLTTTRSPGRSRSGSAATNVWRQVIARAIEQQQACAAALWSRILGDELRRKIEIELANIHPALPKSRRPDNSTSWT